MVGDGGIAAHHEMEFPVQREYSTFSEEPLTHTDG